MKMNQARVDLGVVNCTLHDIVRENEPLKRKCDLSKVKINKLKSRNVKLEAECVELQVETLELQSEKLDHQCDSDTSYHADDAESTIVGRHKYSTEIRKLYYSLLVDQMPVSKITIIIQNALKCFDPSVNLDEIRLPKKSCAAYMRQAELKTVCYSHKAHILCSGTAKGMHLKTDGTTKHQRKLGAVVVDDLVVSVNELANGKAISAIEDISRELIHLRRVTKID